MKRVAVLGWMLMPGPAIAQGADGQPMTGGYAGPEFSVQEHGFGLDIEDGFGSRNSSFSRVGVAGGGFAGFDFAVADRIRVGAEAGATIGGGGGGRADLPGGNRFELRPRWGYRTMARLGYVASGRTMIYGQVGYGAQRYRLRTSIFVDGVRDWNRGLAYGLGVEHRVGRAVSLRLDARRIAGTSNQLSIGLPIRF